MLETRCKSSPSPLVAVSRLTGVDGVDTSFEGFPWVFGDEGALHDLDSSSFREQQAQVSDQVPLRRLLQRGPAANSQMLQHWNTPVSARHFAGSYRGRRVAANPGPIQSALAALLRT
jgi:hypothetical protein